MNLLKTVALSVSGHLSKINSQIPIYMYGSGNSLILGYGNTQEFCVQGGKYDTNSQCANIVALNTFLENNSKSFVFGYVSFNCHYPADLNSQPLLKFVVPSLTIEITSEGIQQIHGNDFQGIIESKDIIELINKILSDTSAQDIINTHSAHFVDVTIYDSSPFEDYARKFEIVQSYINNGDISRLTLARTIQLPSSISLIDSFLARKSLGIENERSYLWKDNSIQFVGSNPELLAIGNKSSFETFKLSGTSLCSTNPKDDNFLKNEFINDKKNQDEHEASVKGMAESLKQLGDIERHPRSIIDWYNLRHMMTKFSTTPSPEISIADILMTILPTGCQPKSKGLEIIHQLESESRDPYYGLIGVVKPDGNFEFSQNIRTIFRTGNQTYIWVGSAITHASDARSEYEETQTKARNTVCSIPLVLSGIKQTVYL